MKILALETATEACSVAVWRDAEVVEELVRGDVRHSDRLLCMVEDLLARCGCRLRDLQAVAFGRGPGSFTGVRLGVGVAQGLAFGAGLPTVPVSTLDALATRWGRPQVIAAIDARMDEVYWRAYRKDRSGAVTAVGEVCLTAPEGVSVEHDGEWVGVGSGWDRYGERMARSLPRVRRIAGVVPHAADVARLAADRVATGEVEAAERALPEYVRQQVAGKPASKAP